MFKHSEHLRTYIPSDMSRIDPRTVASEFSMANIEADRKLRAQDDVNRVAHEIGVPFCGVGAKQQPFQVETSSLVVKSEAPNVAAQTLTTPAVCNYPRPNDESRPGDRLPQFDKMFGVQGIRRAQPVLAQLAGKKVGFPRPKLFASNAVAVASPPRARTAIVGGAPAYVSKFVQHRFGFIVLGGPRRCSGTSFWSDPHQGI